MTGPADYDPTVAGRYDRPRPTTSAYGNGKSDIEKMVAFAAWCSEKADEGRWGQEILYRRCEVCGAQEFANAAGRYEMRRSR
jgi:hypothetical protein